MILPDAKAFAVHRNALVALATAATLDDDFCAHDVIELLKAFGLGSVVQQAREQVEKVRKRA